MISLCDKRSFETKNEALQSNAECQYRKKKGTKQRKPCKAYQCERCGKFHLTSEDLRNPKIPKRKKIRIEKEIKEIRQRKIKW